MINDLYKYSTKHFLKDNIDNDGLKKIGGIKKYIFKHKENISNKQNIIVKCDNEKKNRIFMTYCIYFNSAKKIKDKKNLFIGLDFELNERKIALIQLAFFSKVTYIFVIDPNYFNKIQCKILINTVFLSKINRILHGAESLDIPFIFNKLLKGNLKKITKYSSRAIDTRYLCEYYKIVKNKGEGRITSNIYDALLEFDVVNKTVYEELIDLTKRIGPVYEFNWNIKDLSSDKLKYVVYDVYFLYKFIVNIFSKFKKMANNNSIKFIIPITKMVYLDKWNILPVFKENKDLLGKINNYYAINHNKKIRLIEVYRKIINNLFVKNLQIKISELLQVNYLKNVITITLKKIVYTAVQKNFDIYIKKDIMYSDLLNVSDIFEAISKYKFLAQNELLFIECNKIINSIINKKPKFLFGY